MVYLKIIMNIKWMWFVCVCVCVYIYIYIYIYIHTHTHSALKSFLPPSCYNFLYIFVTLKRFRANKFLYYTKITRVNTKCSCEIVISFIKGKKAVQTCVKKKSLPPKSKNWLCHPWQQQLQYIVCDNWQWVFHIVVEEFWPTLLWRIVLIQPHWRVFEHEWTV